MRNNISASCFSGIAAADFPDVLELDYDQKISEEAGEDDEWWERRKILFCKTRCQIIEATKIPASKRRPVAAEQCILPDVLVERILAMIPFPSLLKVRSLSKHWYKKFSSPALEASGRTALSRYHPLKRRSLLHDASSSSGSFERLVSSMSSHWAVYCPVIIGDEGLIGYDPMLKKWKRLFKNLQPLLGDSNEIWLLSSSGPFICRVSQSPDSESDVFVTNVLTRRCRKLPSPPYKRVPSLLNLFFDASGGYKVFLVTEDPHEGPYDDCTEYVSNGTSRRCVYSQVFDSMTGTWTMSYSTVPSATSFAWKSCSVHCNGNIYCLSGDDRNPVDHPLQVWVYNLREGSWTEIAHPFGQVVNTFSGTSVLVDLSRFQLFACESKVLVVLALHPQRPFDDRVGMNTLYIYELDPDTRVFTKRSSGPPTTVLANSEHIVCDGINIYFCTLDLLICYPVVVYNLKSGDWSCMAPDFKTAGPLSNKRWADFAFQPGLNPFMAP